MRALDTGNSQEGRYTFKWKFNYNSTKAESHEKPETNKIQQII